MDFEIISKSIYLAEHITIEQWKTINRDDSVFVVDFSYCRVGGKLNLTDGRNVLGLLELWWLGDGRLF